MRGHAEWKQVLLVQRYAIVQMRNVPVEPIETAAEVVSLCCCDDRRGVDERRRMRAVQCR